jgi:ppGpp synthetase/RelA/SpoT-type nucleotidyltranferase
MNISKAKIDKAGAVLASSQGMSEDDLLSSEEVLNKFLEAESVFDEYRKSHLQPLSQTTLELQNWLAEYGTSYYIAQRLKRKPQIVRKLNRLSVRLTQLQDIGGCRIIVEKNSDVDKLLKYLKEKVSNQDNWQIDRITDYREKGRDDTGYRSVHLILKRSGFKLELQIRSRIQHYWAESIERTSVIYGYHLKEKEGDGSVIQYFKNLSDAFFDIEAGGEPSPQHKLEIDRLKVVCEEIIEKSDRNKVFDSYINEDVIRTLSEKETSNKSAINNWIIVFDWNTGAFVTWDVVSRNPDDAFEKYVQNERDYPADQGYEVVMIGSSEVSTVRRTHSHYFGIGSYDSVLESIDQSILGFSKRMDIDIGARQILLCLHRKHHWGIRNAIGQDVLKNHLCKNVMAFESSLKVLIDKKLIIIPSSNAPVSLNIQMKAEIEQYI